VFKVEISLQSWTSGRKHSGAEQKSSLQLLESSNDQDHAHCKVECPAIDASGEATGEDSNVYP
jgi:hypothetical protein